MSDPRTSSLNRRHFLQSGGAVALASVLADGSPAAELPAHAPAVGIQLYTMQTQLVRDFRGTLAALGRMGYQQVETVGLLGHRAREFRQTLDAAGLSAPSAHIESKRAQEYFVAMATGSMSVDAAWAKINEAMSLDHIEPILADMFAESDVLGNEYLVLAALDSRLFESSAGIDQVIAAFTKAGDLCHQKGLKFAFHPHLEEFKRLDGVSGVERVLDATDPSKVLVELDFFWAALANVDVPRLLARYSGRFHLGHIKDLAKGVVVPPAGFKDLNAVPASAFEDVGYGQLDYRTWIPLARNAGMRYFFVERDSAPNPLENARRSLPNVKSLLS
jgi:sugar phosphate isomerase/epimerase